MRTYRDAIEDARVAIAMLKPQCRSAGLSLDLRAALLNLESSLTSALRHADGAYVPVADEVDIQMRVAALAPMSKSADCELQATLRTICRLLARPKHP